MIDPNQAHLDALSSGYDSLDHARAAARQAREDAEPDDAAYERELLDDSCFGVPESLEEQQG